MWQRVEEQREESKVFNCNDPCRILLRIARLSDKHTKSHAFQESRNGEFPLTYHTKACGLAGHHWLFGHRVILYLNPSETHLHTCESLEEYSLREFGCSLEFLKKLVTEGLAIVKVAPKEHYSEKISRDIDKLFDHEYGYLYSNIAEDCIASSLGYQNFEQCRAKQDDAIRLSAEKSQEVHDYCERIKSWGTTHYRVHGVNWPSVGLKIHENVLKLSILRDFLEQDRGGNEILQASIQSIMKSTGEGNLDAAVRDAYLGFLYLGTPILYNNCSNSLSVGIQPMAELNNMIGMTPSPHTEGVRSEDIVDEVFFDGERTRLLLTKREYDVWCRAGENAANADIEKRQVNPAIIKKSERILKDAVNSMAEVANSPNRLTHTDVVRTFNETHRAAARRAFDAFHRLCPIIGAALGIVSNLGDLPGQDRRILLIASAATIADITGYYIINKFYIRRQRMEHYGIELSSRVDVREIGSGVYSAVRSYCGTHAYVPRFDYFTGSYRKMGFVEKVKARSV